eukprot:305503-Prorocentrum_minimum.AAC.2
MVGDIMRMLRAMTWTLGALSAQVTCQRRAPDCLSFQVYATSPHAVGPVIHETSAPRPTRCRRRRKHAQAERVYVRLPTVAVDRSGLPIARTFVHSRVIRGMPPTLTSP